MSELLKVRDLKVSFRQDGKVIQAVKGVSFTDKKPPVGPCLKLLCILA